MVRLRDSLIAANSAEITIQQLVFLLVIFPIAGLLFPAITFYWAVYAFITLSVQFSILPEKAHQSILMIWPPFIVVSIFLGILIYTFLLIKRTKEKTGESTNDRRLKKPPESDKGLQLTSAVSRIWQVMGNSSSTPGVFWFVNFNVLARATVTGNEQVIELSSGLWERIVRREWLAEFILAHEIAHLIHGDIKRFRQIDMLTSVVRSVIKILLWISLAALVYGWSYELIAGFKEHQTIKIVLIHLLGAPVVGLFVLLPLIVGDWVIRRYGGFIISLMELRADITAKEWIKYIGLNESDPNADSAIHQTTLAEFGHSLVSINLTHISESERFNILKSIDRLLSPKLRYFGLSLLLAMLVPLNSFTPLLYNGAIDQVLVATTVMALHIILFAMLIHSPPGVHLSLGRSGIVAIVLFFATGFSMVNAYQLGYYLTEFGAAFFAPNGFADKLLDWPTLGRDFKISIGAMVGEFTDAFSLIATLSCVAMSGLIIYFSSVMLSKAKRRLSWLGYIFIFFSTVFATYDPNRKGWYPAWLSVAVSSISKLTYFENIRYVLPTFILLAYSTMAFVLTRRNGKNI